jgi:hypothetical protein
MEPLSVTIECIFYNVAINTDAKLSANPCRLMPGVALHRYKSDIVRVVTMIQERMACFVKKEGDAIGRAGIVDDFTGLMIPAKGVTGYQGDVAAGRSEIATLQTFG